MNVRGLIAAARESRIVRNAGWSLAGELFFIVCQLAMFLMVTNTFTNDVYGVFAGTVALMLVVGPFSSAGAGYLVVDRVVRKGEPLGPAIGRAWLTTFLGGIVFIGLLALLRPLVLPQASLRLIVAIGVAELVFNQLVQASRFIGQAVEKLWLTAIMLSFGGLARLVLAYLYLVRYSSPNIEDWGIFYALSNGVAVVVGAAVIWRYAGARIRVIMAGPREVKEGLTFSINVSSAIIKADVDKTLLARFNRLEDAGNYSSAYRILGLAGLPNQAMADATYSRFFNMKTLRDSRALAQKLSVVAIGINTLSAVFFIATAPYIVKLLDESYEGAATMVQVLALIPLLGALQLFAGNALSGAGHHRIRLLQTLSSAVINVALNLVLIPHHGWKGAAFATMCSEIFLLVAHWRTLVKLSHEEGVSADRLAALV